MSRPILSALIAASLAIACTAAADSPRSAAIQLRNPSSTVTEGDVTVAAAVDDVFATLTDYPRWSKVFPYLATATVVSHRAGVTEVVTVSKKGKSHTLRFRNDPTKRVLRFDELGGRAEVKAEIRLTAGSAPGSTVINVRLYADVHGVSSLFVRDSTIRKKREKKVLKDLTHLSAYFETALAARRP